MNRNRQSGALEQKVTQEGIEYSINEKEKTASVTGCQRSQREAIIPVFITHKSKEYIVTRIATRAFSGSNAISVSFEPNSKLRTIEIKAFSESSLASIKIPSHVTQICEGAFYKCEQLSRVEFEPNSELRTIEKDAFTCSKLASIKIPASAVELKDGWCSGTKNLNHVEVETGNARYLSIEGEIIIGKSFICDEDYDTLVFCRRNSIETNIPPTIKIIGSYSFSESRLASIKIPSHVTKICEYAFYDCDQLSRVEFEPNSELRTIEKDAFSYSKLASIKIPSNVTKICEGAFCGCKQLSRVEFEPNSKLRTIKKDAFSYSSLSSIVIPASTTKIHENAFSSCMQLQIIEIDENSADESINMNTIGSCKILMLPYFWVF